MHYIIFWENFKGLDHLTKVDEGSSFGERPLLLHEFIESSAIAEFVDEVKVIHGL